jgi:hypothetical protein
MISFQCVSICVLMVVRGIHQIGLPNEPKEESWLFGCTHKTVVAMGFPH